jgi:hypothetical protein
MGNPMALAAGPELTMYPVAMGFIMAIPAAHDRPVFFRMAARTRQSGMFRTALPQDLIGVLMTERARFR